MTASVVKEKIRFRGAPVLMDAVRLPDQTFIISGKVLRTASLKNEWQEDVANPVAVARALKDARARVDILKFWQRVPETKAKFNYHKEWRDIATIPISDYKHWFEKQISPKARNKVRKALKLGVKVGQVELTDNFIRGVMGIYNQSPVRRGKPFWHYGKDFVTVKDELSLDLDRSIFVAAYYQEQLIGFIKFLVADRYAMTLLILDKHAHRDKAPMNAMVAKVVEICAERKIPYFTYTVWRRGDHGHFQESNGFEKMSVPEYYIPISVIGKLALLLRLHRGIKGALPERVIVWLLEARSRWSQPSGSSKSSPHMASA